MMFMDAPPRIILNGFETFVPTHRKNLLHQRLVEMTNTNNDMKAWNGYGPVAPSRNNNWDQLGNIETSYHVHNSAYGGYFQPSSTSVSRPAVNPISRFGSYTISNQQDQTYKRSLVPNQDSTGMMNQFQQFQQPDPMLGVPWSGNNLGRGSFSDFVSGQQGLDYYPYGMNSNDIDIKPFNSQQPAAPSQPYSEQSNYNIAYSNYSPASMGLPSQPLGSFGMSTTTMNNMANTTWMSENPCVPNTPLHQNSLACYPTRDDLPNVVSTPQQQQGKVWNASNSTDMMKWTPQASSPSTISPKQMHIANISPQGSFSYSASIPESTPSRTDASSGAEEDSDYAASEKMVVEVEKPRPIRPARQKLPDSASSSNRRHVPILPSNGYGSNAKNTKTSVSPKAKPIRPRRTKHNASGSAKLSINQKSSKHPEPPTPTPKRIQPNGPTPAPNWKGPPQSVMQAQATPQQNARDQFLVESKLAGMSYKEIRRKGGFTEAESTLRGRFRTLTKHKADRVRKPEWSDNDIALLKRAVRKLTYGMDPDDCKIPWKQVAEYIVKYGGSYHFGNATCRKKWDDLQKE